jgi:ERCC4-type nuclease
MEDPLIESEKKRRRNLTPYELNTVVQLLADQEHSSLFDQILALVPKSVSEQKVTFIEEHQQGHHILNAGESFREWEVWITSGEQGGQSLAQQINSLGIRARVVSQSIMVVGDMWIVYKGALVIEVLERKSVPDFSASIMDGRYHEQPLRLVATGAPFVYWMVVGTTSSIGNTEQRQAIHTAISNITHHHPTIKVEQISDEQMVAQTMRAHLIAIQAYYGDCEFSYSGLPTINHIKRSCGVKQLDSQESVWLVWMCTPLRIGPNSARAAVKQYPSVTAYSNAVRACRSRKEAEGLLELIKVPKNNGNGTMNFGKVASKRVLECTFTADELENMFHLS